jgi:hypothetical protein
MTKLLLLVAILTITVTPVYAEAPDQIRTKLKLSEDKNVLVRNRNINVIKPISVVSDTSARLDMHNTVNPVVRRTVPRVGQGLQSEAKEYAKQRVELVFGEGWEAFEEIIQKESGWQVGRKAKNGACGLGQALPCSKLGNAYGDMKGEVDWFINYCQRRYGTPQKALAQWQQKHWW